MDENMTTVRAVTDETAEKLLDILRKYKSAKQALDSRVRSSEEWWRLRNSEEAMRDGHTPNPAFQARSGWLHNVIQTKHADAMDSYPEPNILPREPNDRQEADTLSAVIPCVLEQAKFQRTYSKAWYSKLKFGTGIYKVVWDASKLNGLGDIAVMRVDILSLFWEPCIEDIQDSRYVFEVIQTNEDDLREEYPELGEIALPHDSIKWLFSEEYTNQQRDRLVPVIHAYYHKNGKLHLTVFIPGRVLYSSENVPELAERGIYDHGKYPYVMDALFPIEKSPAGYGFVDLCRNPQMQIDILKSSMVVNAKAGTNPRYFWRGEENGINPAEFLDTNKPIVHVNGSLDDINIRRIDHTPLDGNYLAFMQDTVQELRETSGNSDAAVGTTPSGVTAASAIAALQEASGKTSRDTAMSGYDAYSEIVELCIELVRQFYGTPRMFRIAGQMGEEQFVQYDNSGLQPQALQPVDPAAGEEEYRLPVFDIKIEPQKRSAYTKMANNDLALQFYSAGFFAPENSDSALACLGMMDFDGREELMRTIQRNGTLAERMQMLMQWAAAVVAKHQDAEAMMQLQQIAGQTGGGIPQQGMPAAGMPQGVGSTEPTFMTKARQSARGATVPTEGGGMD